MTDRTEELGEAVAPDAPATDDDAGEGVQIGTISPADLARHRGEIVPLDLTESGTLGEAVLAARDRMTSLEEDYDEPLREKGREFQRLADRRNSVVRHLKRLRSDRRRRGLSRDEAEELKDAEERLERLEMKLSTLWEEIDQLLSERATIVNEMEREILFLRQVRGSDVGLQAPDDPREGWSPEPSGASLEIDQRRKALEQRREALETGG